VRRLTILLATLAALMLVPAAQALATGSTLSVTLAGTGEGEVTSAGGMAPEFEGVFEGEPPIECFGAPPGEGVCEDEMNSEFELDGIALHAIAEPGSELADWGSEDLGFSSFGYGCEPSEGCVVAQTESDPPKAFEITVTFCLEGEIYKEGECQEPPAEFPLTARINKGSGTLVSNPAGIECTGEAITECEAEFEEGSEVTLTASPAAGYRFYTWNCASGTGTVNGRQCTVTMDEAKEVRANFIKVWDLTVSKAAGSELGIVKALPPGNVCVFRCQSSTYNYADEAEVTLKTAEPSKVLHFTEFTGGTGSAAACDGETECTITIEEDSSIEALFDRNAEATLSVEKTGGGTATITTNPSSGIKCLNTCSQASGDFYSEPTPEEVTVNWNLSNGTSSIEWTSGAGTCTGSSEAAEGSCEVTMDEAHELVAKLE
jgi:hypothetical protein